MHHTLEITLDSYNELLSTAWVAAYLVVGEATYFKNAASTAEINAAASVVNPRGALPGCE